VKPSLSIDHGKRCDRIPCYVPDDFLPSTDLDVFFYYEFGVSCFQEGGEAFEAGFFSLWGERGVWEKADFGVFGFDVCYYSR
jgi:hypothetical protein